MFLEAIDFTAEMVGVAHKRLGRTLFAIAVKERQGLLPSAFVDVWFLVDAAHRLWDLVHGLPGLKKGTPFHSFERKLRPFEGLRHGMQHLKKQIVDVLEPRDEPVWGSLAWLTLPEGHTGPVILTFVMPGLVRVGKRPGLKIPSRERLHPPVDRVQLSAFGLPTVSLTEFVEALRAFLPEIQAGVRPRGGPSSGSVQ